MKPTRPQVLLVLLAVAACTVGYMYLDKQWMQDDLERQGVEIDRNIACDIIFNKITNAVSTCDSIHGSSERDGLAYEKAPVSAIRDGASALSLSVDGRGKEDLTGASPGVAKCLVNSMGASNAVEQRFEQTSAMQGVIRESWTQKEGPFEFKVDVEWAYHPDPGVALSFRLESDAFKNSACIDYLSSR